MNIAFTLRSFPDTMNLGKWVATVESHGPNPHGFCVSGKTEQSVIADLCMGLPVFLSRIKEISS